MLTEIHDNSLDAFHRLRHLPHVVFLDSARSHPNHGHYSFLGADPRLVIQSQGNQTTIITAGLGHVVAEGNPWEVLDAMLSRFHLDGTIVEPRLPLRLPLGAAIGFLSYDTSWWLEKMPLPHSFLLPTPDLWFGFYDVLLAFDHLEKRGWLISSGLDESGIVSTAQALFRQDQFLDELQSETVLFPSKTFSTENIQQVYSQSDHKQIIRTALDYIRRGDIYQVNLSHPFIGTVSESPQNLYLRLRENNPAPFSAYLDFGRGQILSSSPERFLKMDQKNIQTRPIKGTCLRTGNPLEDWRRAEALLRSVKDQAELLMITDLLRNDLGKVAEYGSVSVPELFRCEEYETVYHLVSTVEAQLRPYVSHLDTIAACFPGGSITGTPKLRAMEIIHELEPWRRGIYTGTLGYLGFNGISDFNILIRTLAHVQGQVCFHVGSGIVADSDPTLEYEETLHKARGLLNLWSHPHHQKAIIPA